jgi:hypothetical protein
MVSLSAVTGVPSSDSTASPTLGSKLIVQSVHHERSVGHREHLETDRGPSSDCSRQRGPSARASSTSRALSHCPQAGGPAGPVHRQAFRRDLPTGCPTPAVLARRLRVCSPAGGRSARTKRNIVATPSWRSDSTAKDGIPRPTTRTRTATWRRYRSEPKAALARVARAWGEVVRLGSPEDHAA